MDILSRYSIIQDKNPREIVLLRGSGCRWRRCKFCDYHIDRSDDKEDNIRLNRQILNRISGITGVLEVINSGSITDLPTETIDDILATCTAQHIHRLHVECHWIDRKALASIRSRFSAAGIILKVKSGIETFDGNYRASVLDKGIPIHTTPEELARYFDECCLLVGLPGQTLNRMTLDIAIGLTHFERICVNVFCNNDSAMKRSDAVVALFMEYLYPILKDHPRADVLVENTDFGVG